MATTLTLVAEKKLSKIVSAKGVDDYEASGIVASSGLLYVASDNMTRIASMDTSLGHGKLGLGDVEQSQYEAITATDDGRFYVMIETASADDPRGKVVELDSTTTAISAAFTDVTFKHVNQGFEGLAWLRVGTVEYLLALCEDNDCNNQDTDPGSGRVHVLSLENGIWTTKDTLSIPSEVKFVNYSDLAIRTNGDGSYTVAIVSRKSSTVWIGKLSTSPWSFKGPGAFYGFPLDEDGNVQYCSIEGVTFLGPSVLAFASDKSGAGAPCTIEEESVHIFEVPH